MQKTTVFNESLIENSKFIVTGELFLHHSSMRVGMCVISRQLISEYFVLN